MKIAKLIRTDNSIIDVIPENGIDFKLDELHQLLSCDTIELVHPQNPLFANTFLVIDENGKLKPSIVNMIATVIFGCPDDIIVGDALLCSHDQLE